MNRKHILSIILLLCVGLVFGVGPAYTQETVTCDEVILHYHRTNGDYDGWGLHVWGSTSESVTWTAPLQPAGEDDYGLYWVVQMNEGATLLNYIVHLEDQKDPGPDQSLDFAENGCEIWLVQGHGTQFTDPEAALETLEPAAEAAASGDGDQVIVHYRRTSPDYSGWGLHVWGPTAEEGVTWSSPLLPAGEDAYGIYWIVDMEAGATTLNYIVHKGDEKDPGPDQSLDITALGNEIWLIQGSGDQFTDPDTAEQALAVSGVGDIVNKAQAYWVAADTILWPIDWSERSTYLLHYDPEGAIQATEAGLEGGGQIELEYIQRGLTPELEAKYPHLRLAVILKIPDDQLDQVPEILKGQFGVTVTSPTGVPLGGTGLQIPRVLDDLYTYDGPLGVTWEGDTPVLRVWAPTARSVTLYLFPDPDPATESSTIPMEWDSETGVWAVTGQPSWKNQFYLYEVEVFARQEARVVRNLVTDPYSLGLATNSSRSQIVDLDDPALIPDGWDGLVKPTLEAPEDIVLYELHLRDFSAADATVPAELRGTFLAFTQPESDGMRHLNRLAQAGVTHIHLLPVFDIATINENRAEWESPDPAELAAFAPEAEEQQAAVNASRDADSFNWGYDPFHFSTPEGSYSTDPNGSARTLEFRQMVMALNQAGLRVVMDVVYNHTNAAGQSERAVFDRIVPGYYHRLDGNGNVATSTCCPNTATEHTMMEKFMIDSLLTWATAYKVDGFRFDLMGHHMVQNMETVRSTLDALTPAGEGVDGASIFIYGEGWDFGEVANNSRGVNATQLNLPGTGIGTFNDRLRDAARGGNPFGGLQEQGFITGLYTDPNEVEARPEEEQLARLLELTDQIRIGLAGNLADYQLVNAAGEQVDGKSILYNESPAGYTLDPQEHIVYVSAHDNETLFDAIQLKAPATASMDDRVRMQNLGIDLVMMSQGIPFFHAGSELLRSKSMDRDSYNSGDWFNALDWTYTSNNWGNGLPIADKNSNNWNIMRELLGQPELAPTQEHILSSLAHFEEMASIRHSSPLFRLESSQEVMNRVQFHNTGPYQTPGLIVMTISDNGPAQLDESINLIVVLFNNDKEPQSFTLGDLEGGELSLHPIQTESADPVVRTASFDGNRFNVPGRTTAVFVGQGSVGAPEEFVPAETVVEETATPEEEPSPAETAVEETATPEEESAQVEPETEGASPWIWVTGVVGLGGLLGAGAYALRRRRRS